MLVAFPLTFYASAWCAFALYALRDDPFWWLTGLWSSLAGVMTALLAGGVALRVWRLRTPQLLPTLMGLKAGRLQVVALGLVALNLLVQRDRWGVAGGVTLLRPLRSGEVEIVLLPDATLALVLTGAALLLAVLGAHGGLARTQVEPQSPAAEPEQARPEPRSSRTPLVPT
ncbi:MAG: hypothetical protein QM778_34090 [Myxococcales bacterium]